MTKINIYLRNKVKNQLFKDLANSLNSGDVWIPADQGLVWTHIRYGCKVRFLLEKDPKHDDINYVKVWNDSRDWFDQAQAVGTFTQWVYDKAYEYVKKIEIPIRQ